jgi:Lrp/AsnC family transcriptional regulator for asnA, asnC and gidA
MGQHQLDDLDKKILEMVVNNARIPYLEVARA